MVKRGQRRVAAHDARAHALASHVHLPRKRLITIYQTYLLHDEHNLMQHLLGAGAGVDGAVGTTSATVDKC